MTTTLRSLMNTRFPTGELEPDRWYVAHERFNVALGNLIFKATLPDNET